MLPGKRNSELVANVGQDQPVKDATEAYDAEHGTYTYGAPGKDASGAHPTDSGPGPLANPKEPFALKG